MIWDHAFVQTASASSSRSHEIGGFCRSIPHECVEQKVYQDRLYDQYQAEAFRTSAWSRSVRSLIQS